MSKRDEALATLTDKGAPFELTSVEDERSGSLRIYAGGPQSLREVLIATRSFGDAEFLIYNDERLTYAAHFEMVAQLAHWLTEEGVAKGDRVVIGMRNYPEWSVSFFACQAIGAIAVPLNAWWTGPELIYGLNDSGARVAIFDSERMSRLQPFEAELAHVKVLVTRPDANQPSITLWTDMLASKEGVTELPEAELTALDLSTIMYTSGTTGTPKGALHCHRNHITNIQNTLLGGAVAALLTGTDASTGESLPQPSSLQTFPFFHIGGLSGLYISAITGAKLVLMYRWDVEEAFDLIQREQISGWSGVPTVVRQLLEHPRATTDLGSLKGISSGGAPVPEDLINRVGDMFEAKVAPGNGYGSTETTSAIIVNGGIDYLQHPNSVGRPVVTADVRIIDDEHKDCVEGEIGELLIRGPNIFCHYWQRFESTEEAFHEGWFRTGDLGYLAEDGFYYIVDRKKDVIIRGGENVYCAAVEGLLNRHPDVADVALIGLPHHTLGEEVAAVIELKPGSQLTEEDIQALVADQMARFNVPTRIFFIDEPLPRTATGKVLKRELKERFGA